ncbi:MAG TPA: hypothetical protein VD788_06935 [Candidatus Polarisedimenticolaceae bacterium]|nr:hypothetical protein [Candidatus Polarisedimenticolaceae bacterium]
MSRWAIVASAAVLAALATTAAEGSDAEQRWRAAAGRMLGGTSQLRSLKLELTVAPRADGSADEVRQVVEIELPGRVRRAIFVGGEEQLVVIDGARGYFGDAGRVLPLPEPQLRQSLDQLRRDLLVLAANAANDRLTVVDGGQHTIGGLDCTALDVSLDGVRSRLFVTPTGEVIRQTFGGSDPLSGKPGLIQVDYSAYRELDGVRFPARYDVYLDGRPVVSVRVDSLLVNPPLDPARFAVPVSD